MPPTITIIGRINVGKSTLFNRLTESSKAITSSKAGTTRDKNYGEILWRGKSLRVIDTGGVDIEQLKNSIIAISKKKPFKTKDSIEKNILLQTQSALNEADLIVLVVDTKVGIVSEDRMLASLLQKQKKPVILACNKVDSPKISHGVSEFYQLGLGTPHAISAKNGSGVGDILDEIFNDIKKKLPDETQKEYAVSVALIGKPNAGKSSLLNQIVGNERVIVSEIPQTTREPQDVIFTFEGTRFQFIDTAGLKRQTKIQSGIDSVASRKSLDTIKRAKIILYVLDISKKITKQDKALARLVSNEASGVIVIANKWDLIPRHSSASAQPRSPRKAGRDGSLVTGHKELNTIYKKYIDAHLPHLNWAPVAFVSAKTGQNVKKILNLIAEVHASCNTILPLPDVANSLRKMVAHKKPRGGQRLERPTIREIVQDASDLTTFTVILKKKQNLHESYKRFIGKSLRKEFSLIGVNVKVNVSQK